MNIVLIGFSTTGKSSILMEVNGFNEGVLLLDSDSEIAKEYESHIYNLFIANHNEQDPLGRGAIMNRIEVNENAFIERLIHLKQPYIAALGPNLYKRPNWHKYISSYKPFVVFLKADIECVYEGLNRREDLLSSELEHSAAFGNWNLWVTRAYNPASNRYERLNKEEAMANISQLVKSYENYYSKIADVTFEATSLFKWHSNYQQEKRDELMEMLKMKSG